MEKKYLQLEDLDSYKRAFDLSNKVWDIVVQWDFFAKDSVGKQIVRSVDSISANIAEGFGRYHKKDKIKFYRYSYGSIKESFDWIEKSKVRKLMIEEQYSRIHTELIKLPKDVHQLIKFTDEKLKL